MNHKLKALIISLLIMLCPLVMGWAAVGPNWIEQFGITWTFDKNLSSGGAGNTYRWGQFVNGDYWVVGPVTINAIDPPYAVVDSPTRLGNVFEDRIINGSMINPSVIDEHGYTNSTADGSFNPDLCVNANIRSDNPLIIDTSEIPIHSLISTIATEVVPDNENGIRIGEHHLQSAAILTIVDSQPSSDAFRPPYVGNVKPLEIRASSIDLFRTPLSNLEPTQSAPGIEWAEETVHRVWLHHMPETAWWGHFMVPSDNAPGNYGREIAKAISKAALMLNTESTEDKTNLMHYIVQNGIDVYGVVADNHLTYRNNGGGQNGRLLSFAIAAHLLDHAEMKEMLSRTGHFRYAAVDDDGYQYWPDRETPEYVHFGEMDQTHYVTITDVLITNNSTQSSDNPYLGTTSASAPWSPDTRYSPHVPYTEKDIGLPEYGIRHVNFPVINNNHWEASSYRMVSGCTFPGTAFVAHIMGIMDLYNHPAFFAYADRYMATIATYPESHAYRRGTNSPGVFITEMWNAYRANYGPIWSDNPEDPQNPDTEPQPEPEEGDILADGDGNTIPDKTVLRLSNNIIKSSGNQAVTINCDVKGAGKLTVKIYDSKGNEIITLWNKHEEPGTVPITWTGLDSGGEKVGSGIYLIHMECGGYKETKKIAVIK